MKKIIVTLGLIGLTNLFGQNLTEVPYISGFTTSYPVRGEINLNQIPDFTMPDDYYVVWGFPGEHRIRLNAGGDFLAMFRKGFTHFDQYYMRDGIHRFPSGGVSPIPYEHRAFFMQDYSILTPTSNFSDAINYYKPNTWFEGSGAAWQQPFSFTLTDWEQGDGGSTETYRMAAYLYGAGSNSSIPSPAGKPKSVSGTYFVTPLRWLRFDPSRPNPSPYDNYHYYKVNKHFEGIPNDSHTNTYGCPSNLFGESIHTVSDFYSFEFYPEPQDRAPNGTYPVKEVYSGTIYNRTIDHQNQYYWDNGFFRLFANMEVHNKWFGNKPIIPTITLWQQTWMEPVGIGSFHFPSAYSGYTQYNRTWGHEEVADTAMIDAMAIFPYILGAKGSYVWNYWPYWQYDTTTWVDVPGTHGYHDSVWNPTNSSWDIYMKPSRVDYTPVEQYSHALYRLFGQNADMFDSTTIFLDTATEISYDGGSTWVKWTAEDIFQNQEPYVRAMVHDSDILVAAVMPYAAPSYTKTIHIKYGGWQDDFTITGDKVYLMRASMGNSAQLPNLITSINTDNFDECSAYNGYDEKELIITNTQSSGGKNLTVTLTANDIAFNNTGLSAFVDGQFTVVDGSNSPVAFTLSNKVQWERGTIYPTFPCSGGTPSNYLESVDINITGFGPNEVLKIKPKMEHCNCNLTYEPTNFNFWNIWTYEVNYQDSSNNNQPPIARTENTGRFGNWWTNAQKVDSIVTINNGQSFVFSSSRVDGLTDVDVSSYPNMQSKLELTVPNCFEFAGGTNELSIEAYDAGNNAVNPTLVTLVSTLPSGDKVYEAIFPAQSGKLLNEKIKVNLRVNCSVGSCSQSDIEWKLWFLYKNTCTGIGSNCWLPGSPKMVFSPTIQGCQTTGMDNLLTSMDFKLYPNPAAEELNILMEGHIKNYSFAEVEIFDVTNKKVMSFPMNNMNQNIDISMLSKGLYTLKISLNDSSIGAKMFIKK